MHVTERVALPPRFRVCVARPGLEHAPGLVGDFDSIDAARDAAQQFKAASPEHHVTITTGADVPWDQQPAERRHPHGHHFLADDSADAEVIG
ncbi:MAG: hypothetical protein ACYCQK_02060 [Acidiferrobacteraceae bacterium]